MRMTRRRIIEVIENLLDNMLKFVTINIVKCPFSHLSPPAIHQSLVTLTTLYLICLTNFKILRKRKYLFLKIKINMKSVSTNSESSERELRRAGFVSAV